MDFRFALVTLSYSRNAKTYGLVVHGRATKGQQVGSANSTGFLQSAEDPSSLGKMPQFGMQKITKTLD